MKQFKREGSKGLRIGMKTKTKWIDYSFSSRKVKTAIFEYLEKRNIEANRKAGIKAVRNISGWKTGGMWIKVKRFDLLPKNP